MMSLGPRGGSLAMVASSRLMAPRREICPGPTPATSCKVAEKAAKKAAKGAAKEEYTEGTVGTRVDKDVEAIWVNFDKLEGSLNRLLNKLARAAKVAGASTCTGCSSTHAAQAQWHGGG